MPRILVVDDEPHIVILACAALKRAGFQVEGAPSASRALELWNTDIDLLLTDCVMPDLFGDQLAARLREQKPGLCVIFMSGNSMNSLELGEPLEEGVNFIQKPFDFGTLISVVRNRLSQRGSPENVQK
jgi:two-component system, cell cycle sensor histidine kinase and response regulator CckA